MTSYSSSPLVRERSNISCRPILNLVVPEINNLFFGAGAIPGIRTTNLPNILTYIGGVGWCFLKILYSLFTSEVHGIQMKFSLIHRCKCGPRCIGQPTSGQPVPVHHSTLTCTYLRHQVVVCHQHPETEKNFVPHK